MPNDEEIVIVGVGCKFPGANNVKEFWRVLSKGENHVKEIPRDRWNVDAFYDPDPDAPGKTYVRKAGFVQGIDEWDHRFYGINDMEAELIDPQQRLALDCVHMALEDGGITKDKIENTNTAVYIGSMNDDYKGQVTGDSTLDSSYTVTGTNNSIISARISYLYNLHGPALTIDTACSSSLVAIDVASHAIKSGKCDTAICGGVNVLMDPNLFIALSKARMLSPTGQCQTFTADADGYARGEGCGIIILKSLTNALKDGNKIWGTIKTGTNQDGSLAKPISAPSEEQQSKLIEQLYGRENVNKANISVIEAHGTGTPVGDPVEVGALGSHFGRSSSARSDVRIGSVKTNIGHLEAAAGVAGLIKVLLMMKHETIVPSLWYSKENENPKLNLSALGFLVPTQCSSWKTVGSCGRIACVNSFGFGGTNAHAIIEQYTVKQVKPQCMQNIPLLKHHIITLSAYDKPGLDLNLQALYNDIDELTDNDLHALSYTSTCKRDQRQVRKAVHGKTKNDIKLALQTHANPNSQKEFPKSNTKHVVFVYCGVGTAWNGMCADLMKLPAFANVIEQIDIYLEPLTKWKIGKKFRESEELLNDPFVSHIAIFASQIGLTALWDKFGVRPSSVIGQSVGEVAAAFASGYLTLKDAVNIIYLRSKLLASVNKGKMVVIRNIETTLIEKYCESIGSIRVAVYTSDTSCTVSGTDESIKNLKEKLVTTDADVIDIDTKCAYHSHLVKDVAKELATKIKSIERKQGKIPMFSTVTGAKETNGIFNTSDYWKKNVEYPVAFATAVKSSVQGINNVTFVEVGPSPVLKTHVDRIFPDKSHYTVLPSMRRNDDMKTIADTLCRLYELGFDLNWKDIIPPTDIWTDLPMYQKKKFKHLRISTSSIDRMQGIADQGSNHLYVKPLPLKDEGHCFFSVDVDETTTPFVFEHIVNGLYIVPGATYADIGFEIGRYLYGIPLTDVSVSLEFMRPVKVDKGVKSTLEVSTIDQLNATMFHIKQDRMTMCKGWVSKIESGDIQRRQIDIDQLKVAISRNGCTVMSADNMYSNLHIMGFQYGDMFHLMKDSLTNETESLTEIAVPEAVLHDVTTTTLHPCILDAMFQSSVTTISKDLQSQIKEDRLSFLPVSIGELRVLQKPEQKMFAYTRRINTTVLETVLQIHFNVLLFNTDGKIIADLRNYTTYSKRNNSFAPCDLRYRLTWQPLSIPEFQTVDPPNILVLTNTYETATEELFQDIGHLTLVQPKDEEMAELIQNTFQDTDRHYDSVTLLIHQFNISPSETHQKSAETLHQLVKNNCMILSVLVKYMTENGIAIPVFVVTQSTHPTFSTNSPHVNLVGGELWGFVRSILVEFIHGPITLVDVRPSIQETKHTLLRVISQYSQDINQLKPELVIESGKVYGGQFTHDPKCHVIASIRAEHKQARTTSIPHKVLTQRSDGNRLSCLVEDHHHVHGIKSDHINLRVKTIFCHPTTLAPRTFEGLQHDPNIWEESMNDGFQLFGLEFTGYPMRSLKRVTCKTPKVSDEGSHCENEWEYVCIWPSMIKSHMIVPKSNVVHLKELGGQYEPGLLLSVVISWLLVDLLPNRSSVVVYSKMLNRLQYEILTGMMNDRKHAHIIDPTEIHTSNTSTRKIDILIALEKIDSSFFIAKHCKEILCLDGNIPETLMTDLIRSGSQPKITCLDIIDLLTKKLPKILSKAVSWLQKYRMKRVAMSDNVECLHVHDLIRNSKIELPIRQPLNRLFTKSGIYIITGGMTGLGWEMTQLFAEMGAGIIVLLSRRNPSSTLLDDISDLETRTESRIKCVSADVTNYASIQASIEDIRNNERPFEIKGVFHGAGVLNSKLLVNLEETHLDEVLMPKVIGTINIHLATKNLDLDYFVVASSINSTIGSPGQSSYGAANAFMDTFIEWRRRQGLPGQSINWGALSVGMASRKEFVENFKKRGFNLLSKLEIRSCLQEALMCNSTSVIYTDVDWELAIKDYSQTSMMRPKLQMEVLFEQVITSSIGSKDTLVITFDAVALKTSSEATQREALYQMVKEVLRKVIGGDTEHVTGESTFDEVGFDSMSKVTFINIIRSFAGYQIASRFMADTSHTFNDLIQELFVGLFQSPNDGTEHDEAVKMIEAVSS